VDIKHTIIGHYYPLL